MIFKGRQGTPSRHLLTLKCPKRPEKTQPASLFPEQRQCLQTIYQVFSLGTQQQAKSNYRREPRKTLVNFAFRGIGPPQSERQPTEWEKILANYISNNIQTISRTPSIQQQIDKQPN